MAEGNNVLLAGAGGVLGRHITQALTRSGYTVSGLGRSLGADVRADLMDRDRLLAFGAPTPMRVPGPLMRLYPYAYRMATTNVRVSNAKARTGLGWMPRHADCADGLRELAEK